MSNRTARGSKLPDSFADALGCPRPSSSKKTKAAASSKTEKSSRDGKRSASNANNAPRKKVKSADSSEGGARTTFKTPQVMRLIENDKDSNLVIMAGKSRIPEQLRGRESLSRMMKRGLGEEFSDVDDTTVVNITELAIEYEAAEILDRFNACSCDKCVEVFSRRIAAKVPARFARISKSHRNGSRELAERVLPMRKIVLSEMIRELICNKSRCFHNEE